jgi:hypothetical protein
MPLYIGGNPRPVVPVTPDCRINLLGGYLNINGLGEGNGDPSNPTTLLSDDFSEADATSLADKALDVGGNWTVHLGTITVQSGRASSTSAPGSATADAGQANGTMTTMFASSGDTGFNYNQIRYTDADNRWTVLLDFLGNNFQLYKIDDGNATLVDTTSVTLSAATNYTVQVVCNGDNITCTLNGGNSIDNGGDAFNNSATRFGIQGNSVGGESHTADTFVMTDAV